MYACVYIYMHVCVHACVCEWAFVYVCMCSVCLYVNVCVYMCVGVSEQVHHGGKFMNISLSCMYFILYEL